MTAQIFRRKPSLCGTWYVAAMIAFASPSEAGIWDRFGKPTLISTKNYIVRTLKHYNFLPPAKLHPNWRRDWAYLVESRANLFVLEQMTEDQSENSTEENMDQDPDMSLSDVSLRDQMLTMLKLRHQLAFNRFKKEASLTLGEEKDLENIAADVSQSIASAICEASDDQDLAEAAEEIERKLAVDAASPEQKLIWSSQLALVKIGRFIFRTPITGVEAIAGGCQLMRDAYRLSCARMDKRDKMRRPRPILPKGK